LQLMHQPGDVQIMPNVAVQKTNRPEKRFPIFDEIAKRFEDVRHRAFELFKHRGCEAGGGLEDWLKADRENLGSLAAEPAEEAEAYELQVALPGFDVGDVQVTATPARIIVHAAPPMRRSLTKTMFSGPSLPRMMCTGNCRDPIPLTPGKTTTTLEKGVLRITEPKAVQAEKQPVAVKAA